MHRPTPIPVSDTNASNIEPQKSGTPRLASHVPPSSKKTPSSWRARSERNRAFGNHGKRAHPQKQSLAGVSLHKSHVRSGDLKQPANSLASSSSHACSNQHLEKCAPIDVAPTLELSADPEVALEISLFLPLLFRPSHLHDSPPSMNLLHHGVHLQLVPPGMVPSMDSTRNSSLAFGFCCRQRTQLEKFVFVFLSCFSRFTQNLMVQTSLFESTVSFCHCASILSC